MDKGKVIKRINALKKKRHSELEYSVQALGDRGACICILRGGLDKPDPEEYMNDVVLSVVQNDLYNLFIENYLDNPYVKIITFEFNEISFSKESDE